MNKQRLDEALKRHGLPPSEEVVGRKFLLSYREPSSDWGIVAGTITGIGLIEGDEHDLVTLYVGISQFPTSSADERVDSLLYHGDGTWMMITDPERSPRDHPIGELQLL